MARIIYAEDDELMGEIVRSTLAKDGHVVGVVADGNAALRAIALKMPDLVILDCSMPKLSGIQVLERMRLNQALYDMPVLMLTGRQSDKDVSLAAYAGADAYVKKPFDPEYLLFVAGSLLEEGRSGGNM